MSFIEAGNIHNIAEKYCGIVDFYFVHLYHIMAYEMIKQSKKGNTVSTSSCSFWVKPLTPFPAEACPIKVMTLISGVWRFNMAAIS